MPNELPTEGGSLSIAPDDGAPMPPMVYVPAQRVRDGDTEATLELRNMQDGQLALLAYSSLDRLVHACGEYQPWALIPSPRLDELRRTAGFDVVALDQVELPPDMRHGPEVLDESERQQREVSEN